jgi:hypothetical protein
MKVLYMPQMNDNDEFAYTFQNGLIITAYLNGEQDVFDFTGLPEGRLENVETTLPINPFISAKKEGGELFIELLYFYKEGASEEEKFPVWTNSSELKVGLYNGKT